MRIIMYVVYITTLIVDTLILFGLVALGKHASILMIGLQIFAHAASMESLLMEGSLEGNVRQVFPYMSASLSMEMLAVTSVLVPKLALLMWSIGGTMWAIVTPNLPEYKRTNTMIAMFVYIAIIYLLYSSF